jgi:hypothetical protein
VTYVVVVDYAVPPGRGYITKTVPISMRSTDTAYLAVIFSAASDIMAHETPADRLVRGLYLPSSYVGMLLTQGHTRLGYDTVARYLSNKQFIEFVAHGLVGTIGITV